MPLKIRINNLNKKRKINQRAIKKMALSVLRSEKKRNALIDITFVSNRKMASLNKKYMRDRKGPTDVLSFLLEEKFLPPEAKLLGDIYISSDMALRNAKRFNTGFRKELLRYTIHGALHLLGFGDKRAAEKNRIRELEENFLKKATE